MDVHVHTGQTATTPGMSLMSLPFESSKGEHACLLLQVKASPKEAKTLEQECTEILEQALLEADGDTWHRMDGTLKEMNGLFKGLLVAGTIQDIHAIVALLDTSGTLHVSHAGRAEAYLVRGGGASQITEYARGKPTPAFIHISSGEAQPRDTVIFSTQRLLRTVTPAQLSHLTQRGDQLIDELIIKLDGEHEAAALAAFRVTPRAQRTLAETPTVRAVRRAGRSRGSLEAILPTLLSFLQPAVTAFRRRLVHVLPSAGWMQVLREKVELFLQDLKHPERRRKAHLLLLAGALTTFLLIWMVVRLSTSSQRSKTRVELEALVEQINQEVRMADNRQLTGDIDSANAILQRAEERAKQVMDSESGLFRVEALDLLDRIRSKREEINNIIRLSPRVVVNVASKNPDVVVQGLIGVADGEFIIYDRQDLYRVLLNSLDDPDRLSEEELILDGTWLPRYKTTVFLTTGNSVVEIIANQPTTMKTEDTAGWMTGRDIETYLRYLYILSPENNQIYKYERLSNRYAAPVEYNVNGTLSGAVDMTIDSSIYVLKEDGEIVKLLRGEVQPFVIRHAPEDVLKGAAKLYKSPGGNLYILDPEQARVVVVTEGGATGESSYLRQYVFEGDQIGKLLDLYVDPEQTRLYVVDEKRLYVVDLVAR